MSETGTFKLIRDDHEKRLFAMGAFGIIAIDAYRVNIDDLLEAWHRPGGIVRCEGDPRECITHIHPLGENEPLGCVAGWISEEE